MEKIISINFRTGRSLLFSGGFVEFSGIIQLFSWLIWETSYHKNDKRNFFFLQNAQARHCGACLVFLVTGETEALES